MSNRFDFQSTGAAFTNQIANALAQRKAEERQNMLDQLTVNAEQRAQAEATRQQGEYGMREKEHTSRLKSDDISRDITRLNALDPMLDPGSDVGDMSPEDQDLLKRYYRATAAPTPATSTSIHATSADGTQMPVPMEAGAEAPPVAPAAPRLVARGGKEDRDKDRRRQQSSTIYQAMTADPDADPKITKFLGLIMQSNDGILPADVIAKFNEPATPQPIFDQETGALTIGGKSVSELPANSRPALTRTREPYHAPRSFIQAGVDDNGNAVLFDQNTGKTLTLPGVTKPRGGNSGTSAGSNLAIPPAYLDDLDIRESSLLSEVTPETLEGYRGSMARAFTVSKLAGATPRVRQLAVQYLTDPEQVANTVDQLTANGQFSKQDADALMTMVDAVNPQVKQVLAEQARIAKQPKQPNWLSRMTGGYLGK